jgi:ribosomal protein S1
VKSATSKGCFVTLAPHVDARILVSNLSDTFVQDISEKFPPGKLVTGRCASTSNLTAESFSFSLGNLWCSFANFHISRLERYVMIIWRNL